LLFYLIIEQTWGCLSSHAYKYSIPFTFSIARNAGFIDY
jgi:hypothetical protein